jgi:heme/copper-type cytochrome/quinol oxidase subunit 1
LLTPLASNLLIVAAFPVLTATLRCCCSTGTGFHFFSIDAGGNR